MVALGVVPNTVAVVEAVGVMVMYLALLAVHYLVLVELAEAED